MNLDIDETEWEAGSRQHDEALALFESGQLAAAEPVASAALARLESALPGGHPDSANAADTLATILAARGQPIPALALWQRALAMLDAYAEEDLVAGMRLGVLHNLGHALTMAGEYDAARVHIDKAIAESSRLFGAASAAAAASWNVLGVHYKMQGRYAEAAAAYRHACTRYESGGQRWPAFLVHNLAGLAAAQGDPVGAEELSRVAIARRKESGAHAAFELGTDLAGLGDALAGQGRFIDASAAYREALAVYQQTGRASHPEVAYALHNLADVLAAAGEREAAVRCYRESIARKESAFGPDHHEVAASLNDLAVVQWQLGATAAALAASDRAVQITARLAPEHPVRLACAQIAAQLQKIVLAE